MCKNYRDSDIYWQHNQYTYPYIDWRKTKLQESMYFQIAKNSLSVTCNIDSVKK